MAAKGRSNLSFVDRGKELVIRKTKDATKKGDKWDKIPEETREDRIPRTDREVTSGKKSTFSR